jgi:hypothetical protein
LLNQWSFREIKKKSLRNTPRRFQTLKQILRNISNQRRLKKNGFDNTKAGGGAGKNWVLAEPKKIISGKRQDIFLL